MDRWMEGRLIIDKCMEGWMTDYTVDQWMEGWMTDYRSMDGGIQWIDKWMDGWL